MRGDGVLLHTEGECPIWRLKAPITVALQQQSYACCTNALQTRSRCARLICEDSSAPPGDEMLRLRDQEQSRSVFEQNTRSKETLANPVNCKKRCMLASPASPARQLRRRAAGPYTCTNVSSSNVSHASGPIAFEITSIFTACIAWQSSGATRISAPVTYASRSAADAT